METYKNTLAGSDTSELENIFPNYPESSSLFKRADELIEKIDALFEQRGYKKQ